MARFVHQLLSCCVFSGLLTSVLLAQSQAQAATDSHPSIRIGNTAIYSGPGSVFGTVGKAMQACFDQVNAGGGINGRKIEFLSRDDAWNPAKTVEQTRTLVERDNVSFMAFTFGTATSKAVQKYLNQKKVPQLFIPTGSSNWNHPKAFPWTTGFPPTYSAEAQIYAKYIRDNIPDARIAVLYQNDDFGREYLDGLRKELGPDASRMIVQTATYENMDPTISQQMALLKGSGANVLVVAAVGKFAAQAMKGAGELNWKPAIFVSTVSTARNILEAAGIENATGAMSAAFMKDPTDPRWHDDPETKAWNAWMSKFYPSGDRLDINNVLGWIGCQTIAHVLNSAGGDLSRDNFMRQALNLDDYRPSMMLPGVSLSTSPGDHQPMKCLQPIRFNGKTWESVGETICSGMPTHTKQTER